jgi:hypothetical protein
MLTGMIFTAATVTAKQREATEWVVSYWYNADGSNLPRILLVGDSICNGYQALVNKELAGTAYTSFYASSKCITDRTYLSQLAFMLDEYDYAVIHFNNGLHSLNTPPAEWEAGLRAAVKLIKEKSKGAQIIWASSTPLKNPDLTAKAKALNEIAEKVMNENDIPTNDIFALMDPMDRNIFWVDAYHFTDDAKKLQAKQISDLMRNVLGKNKASKEDAKKALKAGATETGPSGELN